MKKSSEKVVKRSCTVLVLEAGGGYVVGKIPTPRYFRWFGIQKQFVEKEELFKEAGE